MTRLRSLTECARTRRLGHHADALAAARRPRWRQWPCGGRCGAAGCRCARRSLAARRLARLVRYLKIISSVCTVHCVTLTVRQLSLTLSAVSVENALTVVRKEFAIRFLAYTSLFCS